VKYFLLKLFGLVWLLAGTANQCCIAQEHSYLNFSVAQGLPSAEVYQAIQDKQGFIWFSTDNGVIRFDGGDFKIINTSEGLSDPVVFGLHEDLDGRIWFRTFTGKLSYFLDGKVHRYHFNDSIVKYVGKDILSDLYYDSLDQLWITAGNQIIKIDKSGKSTIKKIPALYYSVNVQRINDNKDLLTFSGPTHRIHTIEIDNQKFSINLSDSSQSVGLICKIIWNDKTYISVNNDLYEYDKTLKKVLTVIKPIISLSKDKENKLWIGSMMGGVSRFDDTSFSNSQKFPELDNKSVSKVLQDSEDGFWITTLEKGVFYFPNLATRKFNLPPNSKLSSISSFSNHIITTDYSGKIVSFNETSNEVNWKINLQQSIIATHKTKANDFWVSTNGYTYILNSKGEILKDNLPGTFVDFSENSSEIIGVNNFGLYKFTSSGKLIKIKTLNSQFRNLLAYGNDLYMGGKNGLFLFDSVFNFIREEKQFSDIKITNLTLLKDSVILLSTIGNGFILFKPRLGIASRYNRSKNFIADNIYSVCVRDSNVWLGTEKGIAKCNLQDLLAGTPKFNFITKRSGLESNKVNFLAITEDNLWAFTDDGYTKTPLSKIQFSNPHPVAYIKEMRVNNEEIDFNNHFNFIDKENNIQIKIGFLSFNNQNILTRYRLNSKAPWIVSAGWNFEFNQLAPQSYSFQLEYSIDNQNWYLTPINFSFQIHPPWWQTWYFRSALLVFTLIIGFVFYKRRIARYQERNNYLNLANDQQKKLLSIEIETAERERSRIAKDLHDGISSDLISIKLITNRIAKKVAPEEVYEVETQVQKTISEIRNIINGLNPPGLNLFGLSTTLENYLLVAEKNHSIKTTFDFQGEEIKDERISTVIFRIIQELSTNSIKHARCQSINLHINVFSDMVNISYSDNGIGFNPDSVKRGFGLINIESRLESLGGTLNFESGEFGSSYSIDIPLGINSFKK
jgi:signal transduction histidine kinase/ligand-binding sensor domain-containing protein